MARYPEEVRGEIMLGNDDSFGMDNWGTAFIAFLQGVCSGSLIGTPRMAIPVLGGTDQYLVLELVGGSRTEAKKGCYRAYRTRDARQGTLIHEDEGCITVDATRPGVEWGILIFTKNPAISTLVIEFSSVSKIMFRKSRGIGLSIRFQEIDVLPEGPTGPLPN